jgi:hypothetical protein
MKNEIAIEVINKLTDLKPKVVQVLVVEGGVPVQSAVIDAKHIIEEIDDLIFYIENDGVYPDKKTKSLL